MGAAFSSNQNLICQRWVRRQPEKPCSSFITGRLKKVTQAGFFCLLTLKQVFALMKKAAYIVNGFCSRGGRIRTATSCSQNRRLNRLATPRLVIEDGKDSASDSIQCTAG